MAPPHNRHLLLRVGRELPGQAVPQSPPTSCLLLCPRTQVKGERGKQGKPDAGDDGLAAVQGQWRPIFSEGMAGWGGVGRGGGAAGQAGQAGQAGGAGRMSRAQSAMLQIQEKSRTLEPP